MLAQRSLFGSLYLFRQTSIKASCHQIRTYNPTDLPEHRSLILEQYGDPKESVILKVRRPEEVLPRELGPKQVLVEHLAACINPSDISLVRGIYGIHPKLPAILGNEGVTRVKSVGPEVTHLKPGDLAIGLSAGLSLFGYWQSYSVQNEMDLYKVDNHLDVNIAAQLKVNPCTAYRMIKDFCDMRAGDTMIQNGANSAVGVYAIQLAKLWGFKSINIIRDRPNKDEVIEELKNYGADIVLTEAEVSNVEVMKPIIKGIGKPKLFLDCVGGKNKSNCVKTVDEEGYIVTYGAMSRDPFIFPTGSQIFKEHTYKGFWMSRWYQKRETSRRHEITAMLDEISGLFKRGILKSKSTTMIDFEDRNIAFGGSNNTKYLFSINK